MKKSSATAADAAGRIEPGTLFARLAGAKGIVVAVSGGPDSTALMVLIAAWAERPPVMVVSVDHGLRAESAAEAALVAGNSQALGLPCRVLRCGAFGSGNLQAWAREARYALLADAAREAGFDTIVTAHHLDDQAETFLLRLARGSGVYGLGSMAPETAVNGVRLARPLLHLRRSELAVIAAGSGLPTVADPSNEDVRFDRVRMRRLMPILAEHGLGPQRLAGTAERLARAADALDEMAAAVIARFAGDPFGIVRGPVAPLLDAHPEIALRALSRLVVAATGAEYPPALDRLDALYHGLSGAVPDSRFRRTLHGAVVTLQGGALSIRREWGRTGIRSIPAPPGSTLVWDGRFRIGIPEEPGLNVGPLGEGGRRLTADAERGAVMLLPGLFEGGRLIAVPEGVHAADSGEPLGSLAAVCLVGARLGRGTGRHAMIAADAPAGR
jgi:tRNA(Ile)-lysidine synthase